MGGVGGVGDEDIIRMRLFAIYNLSTRERAIINPIPIRNVHGNDQMTRRACIDNTYYRFRKRKEMWEIIDQKKSVGVGEF